MFLSFINLRKISNDNSELVVKLAPGKDTFASFLCDSCSEHAITANTFAFANPLKKGLAVFFGIPEKWFYERELKTEKIPGFDITPRQAMTQVGTDLMRAHVDDMIWVKSLLNSLEASSADIKVVTDVRYKNEAEAILNSGGKLLYIQRDNNPFTDALLTHSSETEIDEHNCESLGFEKILNKSSEEDLNMQAKKLIRNIFKDMQ